MKLKHNILILILPSNETKPRNPKKDGFRTDSNMQIGAAEAATRGAL